MLLNIRNMCGSVVIQGKSNENKPAQKVRHYFIVTRVAVVKKPNNKTTTTTTGWGSNYRTRPI